MFNQMYQSAGTATANDKVREYGSFSRSSQDAMDRDIEQSELPSKSEKRASRILSRKGLDCQASAEVEDQSDFDPLELYMSSEEDGSLSDDEGSLDFDSEPNEGDQPSLRPSSRRKSQEDTARVVSLIRIGKAHVVSIRPSSRESRRKSLGLHDSTPTSPVDEITTASHVVTPGALEAPIMASSTSSILPPSTPSTHQRKTSRLGANLSSLVNSTKASTKNAFYSSFSSEPSAPLHTNPSTSEESLTPTKWNTYWSQHEATQSHSRRPSMPRVPAGYSAQAHTPTTSETKYGCWDIPSEDHIDEALDKLGVVGAGRPIPESLQLQGPKRRTTMTGWFENGDDAASVKGKPKMLQRALGRKQSIMGALGRFS